MITRVKGTQDFLDLTLLNFVVEKISQHCALYQFARIETPIIEYTELFKRSMGLETDVVSKEMFLIKSHDEEGQSEICLRPEATASMVRAFIENSIDHTPWKVFTYGPMFRYERPQKGRFRQFHQISIEVIGAISLAHDVELLVMLDRLFHEGFSLNNYALLINFLGCPEDRKKYRVKLYDFLLKHRDDLDGLCKDRMEKNIMRVFDCKNQKCQDIYKKAPKISDNLCAPCDVEWKGLQERLELLSISFSHEPGLVRGLDYYSKTVFEFVSHNLGAQSAFCAGGRYDQLVSDLGGKEDQPSVGAAIGIERLLMLLEPIKSKLNLPQPKAVRVILPMSEQQHTLALLIADELRAQEIAVEVLIEGSIKSMMRKANKLGALHVLLLGQDEQDAREVTVKNMVTGQQEKIAQAELAEYLKK